MKEITILGWYGTETLGDRAILDGIFITLNHVFGSFQVYLASLYPFFTERTLLEDENYYKLSAPQMRLKIVDECNKKELYPAIKSSDYVVMGGGPIMDLDQLAILSDAFKYAKRCKKITAILGAGLGPLKRNHCICETKRLFQYSDFILFRDERSCDLALNLFSECFSYKCFGDPAIISIKNYKDHHKRANKQYSVCNFRKYPQSEYGEITYNVTDVILNVLEEFSRINERVILVPMHTFYIGGDDRVFLSHIKNVLKRNNLEIPQHPLSLAETYDLYLNAEICLGMRYHSVAMQTILNGNNYIIDYTEPHIGKIAGFLNTYHLEEYYQSRYINLKKWRRSGDAIFYYDSKSQNIPDLDRQCRAVLDRYCTFWKNLL